MLTWAKSENHEVMQKKCDPTCQIVIKMLRRGVVYNFTLFAFNGVAKSTGNSISYPMGKFLLRLQGLTVILQPFFFLTLSGRAFGPKEIIFQL